MVISLEHAVAFIDARNVRPTSPENIENAQEVRKICVLNSAVNYFVSEGNSFLTLRGYLANETVLLIVNIRNYEQRVRIIQCGVIDLLPKTNTDAVRKENTNGIY